ncbi:MAG: acyl-CoA dehydrogenase [Deltaproteobacteria bacterium]|nr:acyl-CoA dehydrogenase [Deltaproteobacteria bacterium]MBN2686862.1 acyl-CoA dehydrogenase [Deltaproteobacteria bacterium]
MGNLLVNTRDQKFVLYEQLEIQKLFSSEKYADYNEEVLDMMLTEAEKMAVDLILPTYDVGDREGCTFQDGKVKIPKCYHDVFKKFCEAGWLSAHKDVEVGGQNMPILAYSACVEYFDAANFAFMMYPGLTAGAAGLIEEHGTEEQKNKYMYRMFTGEWAGTMCLTEPGAGTDVGALRTTAKRLPDGTFSITGTKCFISCGDQDLTENIIHPVLARIEGDPPGTGGISIFVVPKYRVNEDGTLGEFNDVNTGNIEHKMGIKGSATCTLNFGDEGKCIGELLGKEREGMRIMFQMMNEARLEVGMQALGHATAAYERALQYAKERIQSAPVWEMKNPSAKPVTIIEHPDIRRTLLWMKAYVEGIRALNYFTGFCIDMAHVGEDEAARKNYQGFVEVLIPICKAYSSDKAMEICSFAIDVHGGYGYCQEYPVEQYMRDCKIACLYEGTNAIQSLDLVGRKLAMNRGQNVMNLFSEIGATIEKAKKSEDLKSYGKSLENAFNAVNGLTQQFAKWGKSAGFILPVMNARPYLMILGDLCVGWFLLQAANIASEKLAAIYEQAGAETKAQQRALARENKDVAFYQGKIASAKFFMTTIAPALEGRCGAIQYGERIPLEMLEESFSS